MRYVLLTILLCAQVPQPTTTALAPGVRAFRTQAMALARPIQICLNDLREGADEWTELSKMIDHYQQQVEVASGRFAEGLADYNTVMTQAEKLGETFQDKTDEWLTAHPKMMQAITHTRNELQALFLVLGNDRQRIVQVTVRAGLPEARAAEAKAVVDAAYERAQIFAQDIRRRQVAAEAAAPNDPAILEAATILTEWECEQLRIASEVRRSLRELMPVEGLAKLNEALKKLDQNAK